jgi:small subunit ribosomal protein S6
MAVLREYETLYIVAPDQTDDEQKGAIEGLNDIVTKGGGEIIKSEIWGKRRLAYPIKKRTDGIYVLLRTKGTSNLSRDIDVYIRRTPGILRHLTTVVTKQQLNEESRQRDLTAKRAEEARIAAEAAAKREADAAEARAAAEAASLAEGATGEAAPAGSDDVTSANESTSEEVVG